MQTVGADLLVTLVLALTCASCAGRDIVLGGGPGEPGDDAGETDAGGRPWTPFADPKPIAGIARDDSVDDDPSLSADLTVLYFNSEREGGKGKEDIWFSIRGSLSDPWSEPQPATELNSERRETGIALSADGLTIWFSSDRGADNGTLDIFTASRPTRDAAFTEPTKVEALCSSQDDLVSAFDGKREIIYLARRDDDESDYDLFAAERVGNSFQDPVPLAELNTDEAESDAFPLGSAQFLLFTRDEDLVVASRRKASDPFAFAFALDELNSLDDDRDAWVSQDLSYIVFSSNRGGEYRLYEARR
jgi:hypothetical protein